MIIVSACEYFLCDTTDEPIKVFCSLYIRLHVHLLFNIKILIKMNLFVLDDTGTSYS